jgi:hypothetical protein
MLQVANSVAKCFYQYGSLFLEQIRPFRIITYYRDCFVDLHIFTDTETTPNDRANRARRIHSSLAGAIKMQNAQPPLPSNDLLDCVFRWSSLLAL